MKKIFFLAGVLFFIGCTVGENNTTTTNTLPEKFIPNDGRMIAATNCFQCHGTNGYSKTSWDSIAGEDADEFYENDHPIMAAQTDGFDSGEVNEMFSYLKTLPEKD